jgi:hypothetical protein
MNKKNIILGAACGYDHIDLRLFVETWKRYCPENEMWLVFDSNVSQTTINWMKERSVKCFFFTSSKFIPTQVNSSRYYKYLDILLENQSIINRVFLTDTRDVIFQGNIFNEISESGLHVFLEDSGWTCGKQSLNNLWIKTSYGNKILEELYDKNIICSGTTLGDIDNVITYIKTLIQEYLLERMIEFYNDDTFTTGLDQGHHNYILHNNVLLHTQHQNGEGVGTLCLTSQENVKILDDNRIQVYDKIPSVVHQYDRHPEIATHLRKTYLPMKKVLIATPCGSTVSSKYCKSILDNVMYLIIKKSPCSFVYYPVTGSCYIHDMRSECLRYAKEIEATHIIWVDSDMSFPNDSFYRLIFHDLDFVAVNYSTKGFPCNFTASNWNEKDNLFVEVKTSESSTGLEKVDGVGFGLCITSTHLFDKLEEPYFRYVFDEKNKKHIGEDYQFCLDIKSYTDIYIDHDLSKQVGHEGSMLYTYHHPRTN